MLSDMVSLHLSHLTRLIEQHDSETYWELAEYVPRGRINAFCMNMNLREEEAMLPQHWTLL